MVLAREDLGRTYNMTNVITTTTASMVNTSNTVESQNTVMPGTSVGQTQMVSRYHSNAIKLPTFDPETPDLFFILSEATLKQAGIVNPEQIFLYILVELPPKVQLNSKHLISEDCTDKLSKLRKIVHLKHFDPYGKQPNGYIVKLEAVF